MTEVLQITPTDTEQFLQEKFGKQAYHVQQLGAGAWSDAYSFERDGVKSVIRWGHVPDNFERDAFAAKFSSPDLPIPEIVQIGESHGKFFAISPFVSGGFMEQLAPHDVEAATPSILKMFRALRAVDLSAFPGYGFFDQFGTGSHESWRAFLLDDKNESTGSLIHGWKESLQVSDMGMESYNKLWGAFESLIDFCPEEKKFVHSDLINKNVLVDNDKITAVLDWGSAFFGDPLYDIAWVTFYEPWCPGFKSAGLTQKLLEDFKADPHANTENIDKRLLCYQLNISANWIAYNAFRKDWQNAQEAADYSSRLLSRL